MERVDELTCLRRRVKAQRAELRRLNKTNAALWHGWRHGVSLGCASRLRGQMMHVFGVEAVQKAERGPAIGDPKT